MISEERLKRFWEWCGFKARYIQHCTREQAGKHLGTRTFAGYEYPSGEHRIKLPELTLNNLFKWAVPRVAAYNLYNFVPEVSHFACVMGDPEGDWRCANDTDPATALFLAIEKLIEEGK